MNKYIYKLVVIYEINKIKKNNNANKNFKNTTTRLY